jgi:hypothetical protein
MLLGIRIKLMAIHPNYAYPIATGDSGVAIVYRLTDSSGAIWRSAPQLLANALKWDENDGGTLNASGQWIAIPTLRHLLPETTAQIEIYLGSVDLQLFRVIANDPERDFIEFCPQSRIDGTFAETMVTVEQAVANAAVIGGIGEDIYTTGGAIPNDPPPQASCLTAWRNRIFACYGNKVWPSQEFASGLGLQWSAYMVVHWEEGTGDITGVCQIDWSYLAVFKKDAIGIIEGAGPDGMGHGNYIVRTLTTKAGCVNPKSLVNGADGCYYQDSQTNRLMLITPDLQTREAMPGAFDAFQAGAQITEALHVEQNRQVWFFVSGAILVLDYKHRTQTSPMGQEYTWFISGLWGASSGGLISGATILSGSPLLLTSQGELAAQVTAQYFDLDSDGVTKSAVNRIVETGELQLFGVQGMGDVCKVQMLGEWISSHGLRLTTIPQFADAGDAIDVVMSTGPEQIVDRPPNCQRIQSLRFRIDELTVNNTATPPAPIHGAGFAFVGFALLLQPRGRLQDLGVERIV